MKLQLIRNATMKITYGGRCFLTDPMLSHKHEIESFAGVSPNPTIDLPLKTSEILDGVEAVIVSHLHQDHFDHAAQELLSKDLPVFCQAGDEPRLENQGFQKVMPISTTETLNGITIHRTNGRHGTDKWEAELGNVSGFVLRTEGEPMVYWTGDTVLCEPVSQAIETYKPDIIITHSCGAKLPDSDLIVMDAQQTIKVCSIASKSKVVAVHMEALDHATISRSDLRDRSKNEGISKNRLLIPEDGEILEF